MADYRSAEAEIITNLQVEYGGGVQAEGRMQSFGYGNIAGITVRQTERINSTKT